MIKQRLSKPNPNHRMALLGTSVLWIMTMLLDCCSAENFTTVLFQEILDPKPPSGCVHITTPAYTVNESDASYQLVIGLPPSVSSKNLDVNVDFQKGIISVLGELDSSTESFDSHHHHHHHDQACVYKQWEVQTNVDRANYINLYDLVMKLEHHILTLEIPKPTTTSNDSAVGFQQESILESRTTSGPQIIPGKKLRGFARAGGATRINVTRPIPTTAALSTTSSVPDHAPKFQDWWKRKEALERFRTISLAGTDEEKYWLHRI